MRVDGKLVDKNGRETETGRALLLLDSTYFKLFGQRRCVTFWERRQFEKDD